MSLQSDTIEQLQEELRNWQKYASYLKCCAQSGEHQVMSFDKFIEYENRKKTL